MSKFTLRILFIILNIFITAFGASMGLKAAVGVGAWDALSQSAATILGMKVGTFAMFLNISCVVAQLILLGKAFKPQRILQVGVAILLGIFVNFVLYTLFGNLTIDAYVLNLGLFLLSLPILCVGVAMILAVDLVTFPLEALCLVIADKTGWNFGKIRQGFDVGSIIVALALSLGFSSALTIREGTLIGMLVFGPLIHVFMHAFKPVLRKVGLAD